MASAKVGLIVCLTALLAFAGDAVAEESIAGRIRDTSGGAVARAEVILMTSELTVVAATRSDALGNFSVKAPGNGRYLLIARAPGFGDARQAITVQPGTAAPIDIVLQVGVLEDEVTVTAARDSVETLRLAGQPVNVITEAEIGERVRTVVAQAVEV